MSDGISDMMQEQEKKKRDLKKQKTLNSICLNQKGK